MRASVVIVCLAAALAGCNRSPSVEAKNATPDEVAQKVRESGAADGFIQPGLWKSKVTIEKFAVPDMPPEMARQMQTMMTQNRAHDFQTCLTAEDVKKPKEDFFAGKNNQCRYDHFTMAGGKIDAVMHCGGEEATQTMRMTGTYAPDSYTMQMASEVDGNGKESGGTMQMQMRVESRRIGECSPKQA